MKDNYYPFMNLPLPYAYDALEPYIDEKTMRIHHDGNLQKYIDNLNKILETNPQLQKMSLEDLIINAPSMRHDLCDSVKNNAGGVYNHRFFFNGMKNPGDNVPVGKLSSEIKFRYGTEEKLYRQLKNAALSVFGSGYAWLVSDRGRPEIITTGNQDSPIEQRGLTPLLCIDVWEHAYYLQHYNMRTDYIDNWFGVIDWQKANEYYLEDIM